MNVPASNPAQVTIITPTTGRRSLARLLLSISAQEGGVPVQHLLLWDDKRDPGAPPAEAFATASRTSLVLPAGFGRFGLAPGSALRAVGLLVATTPWVTFADDDVWWEPRHLVTLLGSLRGQRWASTLRRVWSPGGEFLGVDRFESVGDDPGRSVDYEMCDNNCVMLQRELGVAVAPLYRQTMLYNDDRLMYAYMKEHAGPRATTGTPTINQTCPDRLIDYFRLYCSPT
jgi:hypothetical protein